MEPVIVNNYVPRQPRGDIDQYQLVVSGSTTATSIRG